MADVFPFEMGQPFAAYGGYFDNDWESPLDLSRHGTPTPSIAEEGDSNSCISITDGVCSSRSEFNEQTPKTKDYRPHECSVCHQLFNQKSNLTTHMRARHESPQSREVCEICGKSFIRRADLRRHMRVHSLVKPYQCDVCLKPYGYLWTLRRHVRRIHDSVPSGDAKAETASIPIDNNNLKST